MPLDFNVGGEHASARQPFLVSNREPRNGRTADLLGGANARRVRGAPRLPYSAGIDVGTVPLAALA